MDETDIKFLELLENNGRQTHEEIGKRLSLSQTDIHQRIAKLEQSKVIKGYSADIDWSKAGQGRSAFIFINIRTSDFVGIMKKVLEVKVEGLAIEKCHRITIQGKQNINKQLSMSKTIGIEAGYIYEDCNRPCIILLPILCSNN
jgi:DNA-binding Lrp family transcriptional regulator